MRYPICSALTAAIFIVSITVLPAHTPSSHAEEPKQYDVVVYGGTSAGIAAAIQVRRMGGSVVVLEPTARIGGLTTGGLGQTDIGNKAAIGGIAREFYQRVRKYYDQPEHWTWQQRGEYRDGGQTRSGNQEATMWTFEPSAALTIIQSLVREHEIPVMYGQRLDRAGNSGSGKLARGITKDGPRLVSITLENDVKIHGRIFIDATYEGDLMSASGVAYTVGRESNTTYQETLNGVQTQHARFHQFQPGVDPFVEPGNRASGLLPGIDPDGPGQEGTGDRRAQAFCFRMCLTDHPENRLPFTKPVDHDPQLYELLLRNFEAGEKGMPWINSGMPNRKTDTNNRTAVSTDFIGQNYSYAEASYGERDRLRQQHRTYQQGLMWTLANHHRVPEQIRREVARWGTCRDEFARADGWQEQLYVREGRRMIGPYVMTQHNCQGRVAAEQSIGLAAYTMDSHNVQRYVNADGHVRNEGDVEVGGFSPYPIDYRAMTPKQPECDNLLVPVCLSASHIAFGSIRMEPVFMVLGQSAATAAMQAAKADVAVQQIDYAALRDRLRKDRQVLAWTGPVRRSAQAVDPKTLEGVVVDDAAASRTGFEAASQVVGPFVGVGYRHDANTNKGNQSARFAITVPQAGRYEVRIAWSPNANRATNVPVTVQHAGGQQVVTVNQRQKPKHGAFGTVGVFTFAAEKTVVEISNAGTDGHVIIDAVQLVPH